MASTSTANSTTPLLFRDIVRHENALNDIVSYHANGAVSRDAEAGTSNNTPLIKPRKSHLRPTKKHSLLFLISAASTILYWLSSTNEANCNPGLGSLSGTSGACDVSEGLELGIAACLINFIVTWNTSQVFLGTYDKPPEELAGYFEKGEKGKKNTVTLALISAVPLAVGILDNTELSPATIASFFAITLLVNTFIHTLPIMILKKLNFFSHHIPLLWNRITTCSYGYNNAKKVEVRIAKQAFKNELASLKQTITTRIDNTKEGYLKNARAHGKRNGRKYKHSASSNSITDLSSLTTEMTPVNHNELKPWTITRWTGNFFYIAFASLVNIGLMGFYVNNYNELLGKTEDIDSALKYIAAPIAALGATFSNIVLAVLAGYFSGSFGRDVLFNNVRKLAHGENPTSSVIRRYPITSFFMLALGAYFAVNSYGSLMDLLDQNTGSENLLSISGWTYSIAKACTYFGAPIFNFKNWMDFYLSTTRTFGQATGSDEGAKGAFQEAARYDAIKNDISKLNWDSLSASLNKDLDSSDAGIKTAAVTNLKAMTGLSPEAWKAKKEKIDRLRLIAGAREFGVGTVRDEGINNGQGASPRCC